jgi:prevent-host-death family protein
MNSLSFYYERKFKLTMEDDMEISAKELRGKPGKIIEQAARGMEVIITLRGKKIAKLIPYKNESIQSTDRDEIFGLWKNHNDMSSVDEHVRTIRKGRKF